MASDEQIIVDITYNTADAEKNIDDLTGSINDLEHSNQVLKNTIKESRKDLEKTDAQLKEENKTREDLTKTVKNGNAVLVKNQTELASLKKSRKDNINIIKSEIKSIDGLKAQNVSLRRERNKLNLETEEGIKRLEEINNQLDKNTNIIKENSSAQEKQFANVGNYASALDDLPGPLSNVVNGMKGMVMQAKAFIATPIGALLALITGAFLALREAVGRSEKATESFNKVGAFFTGIMKGLTEALVPVVEFLGDFLVKALESPKEAMQDLGRIIKENLINRFKAFGVFGKSIAALFRGEFKEAAKLAADATIQLSTGIEDGTDKLKKFGETVIEVQKATIATANAEREYAKAQIALEKTQLRLQDQAEKLRQIRDDEALSFEERIKANNELGLVLDKQSGIEKKLAQENIARAKQEQIANGETIESIEKIGEAEIKLLEIEERITGQRSEQLVNINSLIKEQADAEKAAQDEKIRISEEDKKLQDEQVSRKEESLAKIRELELEDAIKRAETNEEAKELQIEKENEEFERLMSNDALLYEEKELLKAEHADRLKEIDNDYVQSQEELAKKSIDIARNSLNSILGAAGKFSDERFNIASNLGLQLAEISTQVKDKREKNLQLAAAAANGLNSILLANNQKQLSDLEAKKNAELELAGDNIEKREQIERKYAKKEAALKSKQFRQEKALALVNVAIQTALGITKTIAQLGLPAALPFTIAAGVTGAVQAGVILAKKEPPSPSFADGGLAKSGKFGGKPHSLGGTKGVFSDGTRIEVERDENFYVLKKNASAHIDFLDSVNRRHGGASLRQRGTYMQDGGEADLGETNIAGQLADALQKIKVVTMVEDIETGLNSRQRVINNGVV